jgi:hypothetical protein
VRLKAHHVNDDAVNRRCGLVRVGLHVVRYLALRSHRQEETARLAKQVRHFAANGVMLVVYSQLLLILGVERRNQQLGLQAFAGLHFLILP